MAKRIFICYAHKDAKKVQRVAEELQKLGLEIWMDIRNLQGGDLWKQEIVDAVENCDFFLLFISSSSIQSPDVRREVDLASEKNKKIIPIRLDSSEIPPTIQYPLAGTQWIDINAPDWNSRLLLALGEGILPEASSSSQDDTKSSKRSTDEKVSNSSNVENGNIIKVDNRNGGVYIKGGNVKIKGDIVGRDQKKS